MSLLNLLQCISKCLCSISRCMASDSGEGLRRKLLIPMQLERSKPGRKVSIIGGAGTVASATAYTMMRQLICDEIVLIDLQERKDKLLGEAMDLVYGKGYTNAPKLKVGYNVDLTKNSDIIIIACGICRKADQTRIQIAQQNVDIMKTIIPALAKQSPETVFVVVTNPVEIISKAVWQYSSFPKNRIVGTGTTIDSLRFRYHLSKRLGPIHPKDINAQIVFQHSDLAIPIWPQVHVAGNRISEIDMAIAMPEDKNNWESVFKETLKAGDNLLSTKEGSCYTIANIVTKMVDDILRDTRVIHTVSLQAYGIYGICETIYLSLPAVLGNRGIVSVVQQVFDEDETKKFYANIEKMMEQNKCIKY